MVFEQGASAAPYDLSVNVVTFTCGGRAVAGTVRLDSIDAIVGVRSLSCICSLKPPVDVESLLPELQHGVLRRDRHCRPECDESLTNSSA